MEYIDSNGHTKHEVACCRMFDGTLSVRVNGKEVTSLPNRLVCEPYDMERAFVKVILACDEGSLQDAVDDAVRGATEDVRRDLSRW